MAITKNPSKGRLLGRCITMGAAAAAAAALSSPVHAETLRVSYYIGASHPLVTDGITPFMDEIKQQDPDIQFRVFPGGQLGKPGDSIKNLQNGIADIGLVVMTYHREEMPLSQVVNLPWEATAWANTQAFLQAVNGSGEIADEWEKQGIIPLIAAANPPYEIHTADKPLPTLESAKGIKLRSPGGSYDEVLQAVGASPVAIPTPEAFESISRGTVDGTVYAFSNWGSLRLGEIIKHTTTNAHLPSPGGLTYAISKAAFDRLTPEQQKIVVEAGQKASVRAQQALLDQNKKALAKYKEEGLNTYEWSQDDVSQLKEKYAQIRQNWVDNLEASGHPGSATLEKFHALIDAADDDPQDMSVAQSD